MVDYSALKKKFQPKNPEKAAAAKKSHDAVKKIAREFEQKRIAAGLGGNGFKRGPVYYMMIVLVMIILAGSFILVMTGKVSLGKKRISKADIQARQSVDALCEALGRYKFHCGEYPSDVEGLNALAAITPNKKGWFGPYIKKVVPDPWGEPYQYWTSPDNPNPVLMSKGPDRKMGTPDDVLPIPEMFEKPFRDTTWTNHWVPYNLRGIVVAPDEETRKKIQEMVKQY